MSVAIPPFAWVESARMEFPAAVAAGMSAVGHDGGLLTPANTAASMAAPIRATSNGRTASHGETDMSAVTIGNRDDRRDFLGDQIDADP